MTKIVKTCLNCARANDCGAYTADDCGPNFGLWQAKPHIYKVGDKVCFNPEYSEHMALRNDGTYEVLEVEDVPEDVPEDQREGVGHPQWVRLETPFDNCPTLYSASYVCPAE
jgi:hypothetical protein